MPKVPRIKEDPESPDMFGLDQVRGDFEVIFKEDLTWDISIKFHCKH